MFDHHLVNVTINDPLQRLLLKGHIFEVFSRLNKDQTFIYWSTKLVTEHNTHESKEQTILRLL